MSVVLRLVASLVLVNGLLAQRLWIVDSSSGPGTDFTDVPPAIAAANPGDTIRVRRGGVYTPFTVSKGVAILCDPGAWFATLSAPRRFLVQDLPAGQHFTFQGLLYDSAGADLRITNCQGRVVIDRVRAAPSTVLLAVVTNSREVQIHGSEFFGYYPLQVTSSNVVVTATRLRGNNNLEFGLLPPSAGARLTNSAVTLANCTINGGAGSTSYFAPAMPAVDSISSALEVRGDGSAALTAGLSGGTPDAVPGIATQGGTVVVDPNVPIVATNGAPPIGGSATVTTQRLPMLVAPGVAPGATLVADLFAPQGDVGLLLLSLAADPVQFSAAGRIWLDLTAFVVVAAGVPGGNGHLIHAIPIPQDPLLSGPCFVLQTLSGLPTTQWQWSNPAEFVLN
jgi:hypothetical protein